MARYVNVWHDIQSDITDRPKSVKKVDPWQEYHRGRAKWSADKQAMIKALEKAKAAKRVTEDEKRDILAESLRSRLAHLKDIWRQHKEGAKAIETKGRLRDIERVTKEYAPRLKGVGELSPDLQREAHKVMKGYVEPIGQRVQARRKSLRGKTARRMFRAMFKRGQTAKTKALAYDIGKKSKKALKPGADVKLASKRAELEKRYGKYAGGRHFEKKYLGEEMVDAILEGHHPADVVDRLLESDLERRWLRARRRIRSDRPLPTETERLKTQHMKDPSWREAFIKARSKK